MKLPAYINNTNKLFRGFGKQILKERQMSILCYKSVINKNNKEPIIFLEPHSDDIALSISGTLYNLYQQGHKIIIINVFSFTPPDKSPWYNKFEFNEKDYEQIRKDEDIAAFNYVLDCEIKYLNLKSSKYREYNVFYEKPKQNDSAIKTIEKEFIKIRRRYSNSVIFTPAGIGNHVDHVLIKELSMKYFKNNLCFYEDYPYCLNEKCYKEGTEKLKNINAEVTICKINISMKIKLINLYHSQLKNTYRETKEELLEYFNKISKYEGYHEKYWKI
jgi:LmbE family N-acetylglucosaminyl deacetylase